MSTASSGSAIPIRIQRERTRGWRLPENTVYVGNGTAWANACSWKAVLEDGYDRKTAHKVAMEWFEDNLCMQDVPYPPADEITARLSGRNLACWCPLQYDCHADLLLKAANGDRLPEGTPVRYWPGTRTGKGRLSVTRTPIFKVGSGTEVVSVDGYPGGIALSHLEPIACDADA